MVESLRENEEVFNHGQGGIALLKKTPSLSPEEFRRHYEEVHAPLVKRVLPSIKTHVRNHVTIKLFPSRAGEVEFDCITEQWFDNMEGFQAMVYAMTGEAGRAIRDDERQ